MFRRYEVVFVFSNATEPYKKFWTKKRAQWSANSINLGRNRLGLYDIAHVRHNGHFGDKPRSGDVHNISVTPLTGSLALL